MTDTALPITLTLASGVERIFPTLTPAQVQRIAVHGQVRSIQAGEVLFDVGEHVVPFFVVMTGRLEIILPSGTTERLVTVFGPGQFTGEVNMLSGRPVLARSRAREAGEVIELDREHLVALVQTDSEIGEIIMRAFITRRVELIAQGLGDVVVVGSNHCSGTLRVKEFLTRNSHPFNYIDLDRDVDVQGLLDQFHVTVADVPVVICRSDVVLRNPTIQQIADCLGFIKPRYATWLSSAPDQLDSPPPCTAHRKAWMCLSWRRTRREDRLAPARRSKIILVFRPASQAKISRDGPMRRRRNSVHKC
jgi:thioredoxin reductase (NADPH)